MKTIALGATVTDRISGFNGVALGRTTYLTGCDQILVAPTTLDKEGKKRDCEWFDAQRLVVDDTIPVLVLDNGLTPGCDIAAPKK